MTPSLRRNAARADAALHSGDMDMNASKPACVMTGRPSTINLCNELSFVDVLYKEIEKCHILSC
jgi:hypothetical protein